MTESTELPFFGHIIDGKEVESDNAERFDTVNPWTREPWARVALGGRPEAELAIAAARRAFDEGPWPKLGFTERERLLGRLADLMEEHADELGQADSRDMGKPLAQCRNDVARAAWNFRFFAQHAKVSTAETLPMDSGHHAYTRFEPAGVVVAIAPWNFPLMLETWKVAPALAWGNTVVLKPAEDTPTSATIMARLALEAGLPPGVFNVVHGYGPNSAGSALTEDPRVNRITFTGESGTGKIIGKAAMDNLIPVSLELGGKNPNIVFADADLDNAVSWSIQSIFRNAGQVCLSGSRLYVQREIHDEFVTRFVAAAEAMRFGDPLDPETEFGPLASQEHFEKVRGYVETIESEGGTIATGGLGDGWFVKPTIVVGMPRDAKHVQEEIFGPVVVVEPFDTEDEVVALANNSEYGLDAQLFTENVHRAHRVAAQLQVGTVWVNCYFVRDLRAPFGGTKRSGIGREGGNFSREFFTEPKAVILQIDEQ
ncbi:aldehyde dehydrogenase [Flexivirga oryzae]|uniref:Aminomuconate-semialdehyde/2-hydroxymuconate-6-semialdehyde dehydrogenase n=1 Tax=Flexivirga oryzae TaxID=1794944 RepID=A0A839N2J2_9MICO|nr:aldehyde dehydrogenase [Flexivirga oryzae]MBB2891960.1 aminomuconate-semialdehyde/2-hydroxymuconate-6-semialdehyde dehydrogenase [Flexivirga oryzae]